MGSETPANVVMVGEIGTDADEVAAVMIACHAMRQGYLELLAFVGNHVEALLRARNAKRVLTELGFGDIPVGMGERGFGSTSLECERDPRFLAHPTKIGLGRDVLRWTLQNSEDHSVVLALNSGFTDAVWLWMDCPELFMSKVRLVVIMGGIEMDGAEPVLSNEGFLVPSIGPGGAANNNFDPGSTRHLYDFTQRHGIPTITTTRFAAYGCKVPFSIFSEMGKSGSLVGARVGEVQEARIRELWAKANAPLGSFERGALPDRCDRKWFLGTFCEGRDPGDTDIVPFMAEVAWYDPLNLIACSDPLRERFFAPYQVEVKGIPHRVIGLSSQNHGIRAPKALRRFMKDSVLGALKLSLGVASAT